MVPSSLACMYCYFFCWFAVCCQSRSAVQPHSRRILGIVFYDKTVPLHGVRVRFILNAPTTFVPCAKSLTPFEGLERETNERHQRKRRAPPFPVFTHIPSSARFTLFYPSEMRAGAFLKQKPEATEHRVLPQHWGSLLPLQCPLHS